MKPLLAVFTFIVWSLQGTVFAAQPADELFNGVLNDHVSMGFVDYPAIAGDGRFNDYLEYIAETDPSTFSSEPEKLAFWINAYNALAIKGIIDGLSPDGFFARVRFFKTTDYRLAGREINLYDLEREIIIPFAEPRIHFAIVCASASCPKLTSEIYRAETLDQQLDEVARSFINNTDKNQFDTKLRIANLSKIFDWFTEDFEQHSGSVANYLRAYAEDEAVLETLASEDLYVRYLDYDWSLNGKPLN